MSTLHKIIAIARQHKKILAAALGFLLIFILSGWSLLAYRETQSPQYALKRIQQILQSDTHEELADFIDFRGISASLRAAALPLFGIPTTTEQEQHDYDLLFQKTLVQLLRSTPDPEKMPPRIRYDDVRSPLPRLVPCTLPLQLRAGFSLVPESHTAARPDDAIASLSLSNADLEQHFKLLFQMKHSAKGWQIIRVLNTKELIATCQNAMTHFREKRQQSIAVHNTRVHAAMNSQLHVDTCKTMARTLSDGNTVLLMTSLELTNRGPRGIDAANITCTLYNVQKTCAHPVNINVLEHAPAGSTFKALLTESFSADSAMGKHLSSKELVCEPAINSISLDNGELLFFLSLESE